jgi:hypothetical protein
VSLGPTQLPVQCVLGSVSTGVRRPGRKANHSPPSGAEFKNGGAIPSLPNIFMAWCLVKPGDNFTFALTHDC